MNIITRILEKWLTLEPVICQSCEHWKLLLEQERVEKNKLLNMIVEMSRPIVPTQQTSSQAPKPIRPSYVPWQIRRAELEANDRKQAQILQEREREIAGITLKDLEDEIEEINNADQESGAIQANGNGGPREERNEEYRAK